MSSVGQENGSESPGPQKSTRFGKRKQKRGKRARSDGFVLGVVDIVLSDEEGGPSADMRRGSLGPDPGALNFLLWIRNPTLQNLSNLRKAIMSNDRDWMKEFLEFDGLGLLFQCLNNLSSYHSRHLTDMVLRMECVSCIREVVNSQIGLDCLLKLKDRTDNLFGRRFASGRLKKSVCGGLFFLFTQFLHYFFQCVCLSFWLSGCVSGCSYVFVYVHFSHRNF